MCTLEPGATAGEPPVAVSALPVPETVQPVQVPAPRIPRMVPLFAQAGVALAIGAVAWMARHVQADSVLHRAVLSAHLTSFVLRFGAVLAVAWTALRWRWVSAVSRTC